LKLFISPGNALLKGQVESGPNRQQGLQNARAFIENYGLNS